MNREAEGGGWEEGKEHRAHARTSMGSCRTCEDSIKVPSCGQAVATAMPSAGSESEWIRGVRPLLPREELRVGACAAVIEQLVAQPQPRARDHAAVA